MLYRTRPWGLGLGLGRGVLTRDDVSSRKGYAGYVSDEDLTRFYHVHHRVYDAEVGRWTRRDKLSGLPGSAARRI